MYMGMLTAQPGHVVAKLNGLTKDQEVILSPVRDERGKPRRDENGQLMFNVFESRVAAAEYRNELARQAFGEMTSEARRRIEQFESIVDKICDQASRTEERASRMEDLVSVLAKSFKNAYPKAPTVNVREIAKHFGWKQPNARKVLADKRFRKHVIPTKVQGNSHKEYTLDVIHEIYAWQNEKAAAEAARQAGKKKAPPKP